MGKKVKSEHFLLFVDFSNSFSYSAVMLERGQEMSEKLRKLEEFYSSRFVDNKLSFVDSLVRLEEKMRFSNHQHPKDFNSKVFEKKVEEINNLIDKYNKVVKSSLTPERLKNQKSLLNDIRILSCGTEVIKKENYPFPIFV